MESSRTLRATALLGTLKKEESNTEVLVEFLADRMAQKGIECETVKLIDYTILPGTFTNMGTGDEWPVIFEKIISADVVIFATPIWWGNHSSEIQKVIERLDAIHDEIMEGKRSILERKVAGIVITGDSDGAQHIIGTISNFCNALGMVLPPHGTLSVLWEGQAKFAKTNRAKLTEKYAKEYARTADTMAEQIARYARLLS